MRAKKKRLVCVAWVHMQIFWIFFPPRTITKFILYEGMKTRREKITPKCQTVLFLCLNPGIDRTVLILYSDICLKVAFDLNFNLQTVAGKGLSICFRQHNKMSRSSATIYHQWQGTTPPPLHVSVCVSGNIAMANICLGETTKEELLLLPWGEPFLSLHRGARAA